MRFYNGYGMLCVFVNVGGTGNVFAVIPWGYGWWVG